MHRTHLHIFSLLLCLFGLVAGCSSEPVVEALPPLIVINDQEITKADFLVEFEQSLQKDQQLTGIEREELQRSFLVQLIDRELIHGEARQLNIEITEADVDAALQVYRQGYTETGFETMLQERGITL